jgi:hypothetical protein
MNREQRLHVELVKGLIGHQSYSEESKVVHTVQKKVKKTWIG